MFNPENVKQAMLTEIIKTQTFAPVDIDFIKSLFNRYQRSR